MLIKGLLIVKWSDTMHNDSSLAVTLSVELFELLTAEARKLGLPLEWLVASLVVDTVDKNELKPILVCA